MTNLRRCVFRAVFFVAFCFYASSVFAQTSLETYAQIIERGNVEQKRDVLIEIRNLENAEASRVAVPLLKDSSEIVRATAAFSVIFLPKDEAAQNLIPLLSDKKPFVRREAAYALGKTGSGLAIEPLLIFFRTEKNLEVRNAEIIALGEIGNFASVSEMTKILQQKPNDKEDFLRRSAARSIGQIAQIIQIGKVGVITPETFSSNKQQPKFILKNQEVDEVLRIFRPATEILIRVLQNKNEADDTKREAAFALGAIGDESAVSILQNLSAAEDYYLAEIAREALSKIRAANQTK